jgi:hypothetical protein
MQDERKEKKQGMQCKMKEDKRNKQSKKSRNLKVKFYLQTGAGHCHGNDRNPHMSQKAAGQFPYHGSEQKPEYARN